MVFRPELSWERLSSDEIAARTLRALRNHVHHCAEASPFYRTTLQEAASAPLESFEEFAQLPFTDKTSLAASTTDFLAINPERVVETVVTSGSTGTPLCISMSAGDLDRLAFNEALSFYGAGITAADRAQVFVSLDRLFIAGMAYYRGLTLLGANTSRIGVLPPDMQKQYLELLQPTVIVGVPSFLCRLGRELNERGFDTRTSSISRIICIGESVRTRNMEQNPLGRGLEELFRARVFSTYGNTELATAYCECTAQCGGHAHPELIYTEIIDEEGNVLPDNTPGELVATPLGVEGMPLVRYRTGDITFKVSEPCACGRNSVRIGPILARKSQMIKLQGTTVYPLTLTNTLDEVDEVDDYIIELDGDESLSDRVTIHAATRPDLVPAIAERLRANARVNCPILVTNQATLDAMRKGSRKKIRLIDRRRTSTSSA